MSDMQTIDVNTWPVVIVVTNKPDLPLYIDMDETPEALAEVANAYELELVELLLRQALDKIQQAQVASQVHYFTNGVLTWRLQDGELEVQNDDGIWQPSVYKSLEEAKSHYSTFTEVPHP